MHECNRADPNHPPLAPSKVTFHPIPPIETASAGQIPRRLFWAAGTAQAIRCFFLSRPLAGDRFGDAMRGMNR